jgi:hypothetical protein
MKPGRLRQVDSKFDQERATALLLPIAAFLRSAGLDASSAERSFARAILRASKDQPLRSLEKIGRGTIYADIVSRWRRDSSFLDGTGTPRDISLSGRNGFFALVRKVEANVRPKPVLDVLCRYGNVRKLANGKYRLLSPLFSITSPRAFAFEPMASFLFDVTSTFDRIVRRSSGSREPRLFWRKVETTAVPQHLVREFMEFVSHRSLTFLEEIDDWLEAHAAKRSPHEVRRRVGLGLFSVYSDREGGTPLRARSSRKP